MPMRRLRSTQTSASAADRVEIGLVVQSAVRAITRACVGLP